VSESNTNPPGYSEQPSCGNCKYGNWHKAQALGLRRHLLCENRQAWPRGTPLDRRIVLANHKCNLYEADVTEGA